MNSVASNNVATLMNSNFGANQTTSTRNASSSNEFHNIFNNSKVQYLKEDDFNKMVEDKLGESDTKKVKDGKVNKNDEYKSTEEPKANDSKAEKAEETDMRDDVKLPEDSEDSVKELEEMEEVVVDEVVNLSEADKTNEALMERMEKVEDIMIDFISNFLNISEDELSTMLNDMGMTPIELMQMQNITSLVGEFFGLDNTLELLLDEDATQLIKEIDASLENLIETTAKELGLDVEALKAMVNVASSTQAGQTQLSETMVNESDKAVTQTVGESKEVATSETQGAKVEVQDLRAGQNTTEYSQDSAGGENQSFASMMAKNADVAKEVVVINNGEQVIYKEIDQSEVINQIVTKAVVKLTDTNTTMQLQLNPGHLGKIGVQMTTEQGVVKGQFIAESQVVKEMIESNIVQLKEQLEEQGVKVDKIEVTVGNSNQFFDGNKERHQQNSKNKANRNRINRLSKMRSIGEVVGELTEVAGNSGVRRAQMNSLTEHTIDFSA